ncbi:MAG: dephospho-CoA kinase [Cyclobacteriaceae bacterium]|jgi:dephospho-CoA kinase|nr:dephospho-CoA kinase [Cyclobacteriaceae bacterium]
MFHVGITGGIGTGKSLVCDIFKCVGIPVYDADSRAKELMTTDGILVSQIKKEFGTLSYDEAGGLNRVYLARVVFGEEEKRQRLNALVHPRVAMDYQAWASAQQSPYVLREAALMYEAGAYRTVDFMIVVTAPEALRLQRVRQRDPHRTAADIQNIMARQWPEEEKIKRADAVIVNDETQLVIPQVLKLHERLLRGNQKDV